MLTDELEKLPKENQPDSLDSMFKENDMNAMMSRLRDTMDRMLTGEIARFKDAMAAEMTQHMEAKGKDMMMRMPKPKDGKDGMPGMAGGKGMDGSPDSGADIVGKINELEVKPELQIDAKHIKNLPQERVGGKHGGGSTVVQEDLSSQVNGVTRTFTTVRKIGVPLMVASTQFPTILRNSVDYTASGNTLTLDSAIDPIATGQTLIFVFAVG